MSKSSGRRPPPRRGPQANRLPRAPGAERSRVTSLPFALTNPADPRLAPPAWRASSPSLGVRLRTTVLAVVSSGAVLWYFTWLLRSDRVGNPVLFGILLVAECFNVVQALGFWWTCAIPRRRRPSPHGPRAGKRVAVDVFIPTYNEPVEVVEATVAAATQLRGAAVRVALLDDGNREEMEQLAARYDARYVRRTLHQGAKAGNINHALGRTDAPYVLVLDCDHVPDPAFLEKTLLQFSDPKVAFVQTPQYYANAGDGQLSEAAWRQQALFFGPIARGKDDHDSMFCCGTGVVFRRSALVQVGGFPEGSLTEDFELSVHLHERGWRSRYVPEVLARGLGPEDLASYVSQQHRWARGCLTAIPHVLRSELPLRQRLQYLLSASYFLSGWTVLVYLLLPVIRIAFGVQPIASTAADNFLAHFVPYFGLAIATVAAVGSGTYTFRAYSLATATFWIHVHATVKALLRRPGRFVVTPKLGGSGRQFRPAAPTLTTIGLLASAAAWGMAQGRDPATLNNVAFVFVHLSVLSHGIWPALAPQMARASTTTARTGNRAHAAA